MASPPPQKTTPWGAVIYTLEGSIQQFFHTFGGPAGATQPACDAQAAALAGGGAGPVTPVPIQGQSSYTVVAGPPGQARIVQFRAARSKLDMAIVELAAAVHPDFVPWCRYHGPIGDAASSTPLHVYVIEKREGLCSFECRDSSVKGAPAFAARQFQTVRDFARQVSLPTPRMQVAPAAAEKMRQDLDGDLARLAQALPARFQATVQQARTGLPAVFALLPFALTHGDLYEGNILVDKADGRITGIIDWAEAEVAPFGLALWGLESVLGYSDREGWHPHGNAGPLRDEFWRVFEAEAGGTAAALSEEVGRAIRVARMAGMLLIWCFKWDEDGGRRKVRGTDVALRHADTFCTGGI
ncbi:hypothetical protein PG994_007089 [Apiospora phragmitis]|uniref:Aminoglycoside phosphotransferase domain-containing protein n=1 Tax=Apiospora phragmitis TaxID=2905665 RepID=A0ABR1UZV4_9PEZI